MQFIVNWLLSAVAIIIAAYLLPGVTVASFGAALIAALILGLLNAIIRPILLILTLPINILTLGLFTFVINAVVILLTDAAVEGFAVQSFFWALIFSLVLAAVNFALNQIKESNS